MMHRALPLALFALAAAAATPGRAQEFDRDELLKRHYEALGGLEKIKAVETIKMTGRMLMGPGMEARFVRLAKRPNRYRMEFTVQGMTGVQAYDGETAWMYMPFTGRTEPEVMPEDLAKQVIEEADMDGPLVDYQEKGHQVELLGKEDVEGSPAYKLKVTLRSGEVSYYYLDAEYFLLIKTAAKRAVQGTEVEVETSLGDYREVDGLMVPFSIRVKGQGPAEQTIILDTVELNVPVDEAQFKMPQSAPRDGAAGPSE